MKEGFSFTVTPRDGTVVLRVRGALDRRGAERLHPDRLDLPKGWSLLVMDLSEVGFMDSAGVSLVAALYRMARRRRRLFALCCPQEEPRRALELGRLNLVVPIYGSVEEVERAVREGSFA